MFQPIDPKAGTLVVHGQTATLFAAVGEPVPTGAQMGVAEAEARATMVRSTAERLAAGASAARPAAPAPTTFRWSAAPGAAR